MTDLTRTTPRRTDMATYEIPFTQTVSGHLSIEADTLADAVSKAERKSLPSLMFVDHTYPDESGWEVDEDTLRNSYPGEALYADEDEED